MNLELHYPDDVLERYAMGKLSALDYVPLEQHLLICTACQTKLLAVEDYILIARAALAAASQTLVSAQGMPDRPRIGFLQRSAWPGQLQRDSVDPSH